MLNFENDSVIFWIYDGYLMEIAGNLAKKDMLNLAYSTKIIDYPKYFKKTVTFCLPEPFSL